MAVAQFRISQGLSVGTPGRTRHDLVAGTVITLEATAPLGAGITYAWEILDKIGATAVLTATTGISVDIGSSGGQIVAPCAFRVKLTVNDNGVITSTVRIATVLSPNALLPIPTFAESAPSTNTLNANTPDASEDNAVYTNRAGLGVADQNWRGWAEWAYMLTVVVDQMKGGAVPLGGDLSGTAAAAQVVGLKGKPFFGTPSNNNAIFYDSGANRWYFAAVVTDPTLGGDLAGTASAAEVIGIETIPISGTPSPTGGQLLVTFGSGDPAHVTSWIYTNFPTTPGFSNVLYVDPTRGNNSTAIRGDFSKPYATVAAAMAALQDGDCIACSPGVHVVSGTTLTPAAAGVHFSLTGSSRGDIFSSLVGAAETATTQLLCNGIDLLTLNETFQGVFISNLTMRVIGAGFRGITADASAGAGTSMQAGLILSNVKIEAEVPFNLVDLTIVEMTNCHIIQSGGATPSLSKNCAVHILANCFGLWDMTAWWDETDTAKPVVGRNGVSFQGTVTNGALTLKGQASILGDPSSAVQSIKGDTLSVSGGKAVRVIWNGGVGDDIDFGASSPTRIPDSGLPIFDFTDARLQGAGNSNITFAMPPTPSNSIIVSMRGTHLAGDLTGTVRTITAGDGVTIDIENADIRYYDFALVTSGSGSFGNVISTSSGANINDLDLNVPYGQEAASTLRITPTANIDLTGIARTFPNSRKWIVNAATAFNITLKNQNTNSSSINRLALGGTDIVIGPGRAVELLYDGTTQRWRLAQVPMNASTGVASVGTANSVGTQTSLSAPVDHVHDHGSQSTGSHHAVATSSVAGFAPIAGAAGTLLRSDGTNISMSYGPGRTITGAGTLAAADHGTLVLIDENGASRAIAMPASNPGSGWHTRLKRKDTAAGPYTITITQGASESIEGVAGTYTWVLSVSTDRPWLDVWSDGTDYWVM